MHAPRTVARQLQAEESPVGKVAMYSSVSVDGFIADENDQPGPLFDWLSSGDVPLDETGQLKVSQASYDHTRAYWDQIGVTIVGRHVFDLGHRRLDAVDEVERRLGVPALGRRPV